jgi:hypothetical protein
LFSAGIGDLTFGLTMALLTQPALAQPQVWNGPLSREQAVVRATAAGFDVRMARADAAAARGQAIGQTGKTPVA